MRRPGPSRRTRHAGWRRRAKSWHCRPPPVSWSDAQSVSRAPRRVPAGHPEAFLEAFANIYTAFAQTLRARLNGTEPDPIRLDFPGVDDGVRGMAFIDTVVASDKSNQKWTRFIS